MGVVMSSKGVEERKKGGSVRNLVTTGESVTKHGQAIRTGFIVEFIFVRQIHTVNTNSAMKPVGIA